MKEIITGLAGNVHKGWKTTALGVVVIISAIVSVFVKDLSWGDACIGLGLGIGLCFAPDSVTKQSKEGE